MKFSRAIKYLDAATWPSEAAFLMQSAVQKSFLKRGFSDVMLTGGRSAEHLYRVWAELPDFKKIRNTCFYFGDERCVPPDHPDSNYGLAMRTLFKSGVPPSCEVIRMEADRNDRAAAAVAYENQLPDRMNVLLLSVGEDGHIASLFPEHEALNETRRRVVPVRAPKRPQERLTITPPVLAQADRIFVLAMGAAKAAVLRQAQLAPQEIANLPARLVLRSTWLLNTPPQR